MPFRPAPTNPDQDGQQAEDAQLYRAVLHELIHIGTDLARLTHQHAVAHAQAALQGAFPATSPQDHAAAFGHVARAIRRTIALARSLAHPPAQPRAAARPILHSTAAAPERAAADAPSTGPHDHPEAPGRDRDAPDRDDGVTGRPPAEVIAEIRRDLGLDPQPGAHAPRRTPAAPPAAPPADMYQPCARAVPGGARQPGLSPGGGPPAPGHGPAQRPPGPQLGGRAGQPAAIPRARPGPVGATPLHAALTLPDGPAEAVAAVLRHPARARGRWRPPPGG